MGASYLLAVAVISMAVGVLPVRYTECPLRDPAKAVHLPHETDCDKFYKCSYGKRYLMNCPLREKGNPYKRLYFNPELEVCDWPWNVNCKSRNPNCTSASDNTIVLNPIGGDCSSYTACVEGAESPPLTCDEGFKFDCKQRKCLPENVAVCCDGGDDTPNITHVCPPLGSSEQKNLTHECYCALYYECINGESVRKTCPPGEKFDSIKMRCVPSDEVTCAAGTHAGKACPRFGSARLHCDTVSSKLIRHECQCNLYYGCSNGNEVRRFCPDGQMFDVLNQRCMDKSLVDCLTVDENETNCVGTCPRPGRSVSQIYLPHEDCSRFCMCLNTEAHVFDCSKGLEFSQKENACTSPGRAQCQAASMFGALVSNVWY